MTFNPFTCLNEARMSINKQSVCGGIVKLCESRERRAHLRAPLRVDGVADHSRAFLLAVMGQRGEDAVLPRLDGELQVRVGIEEHPLLQSNGLEV